MGDELEDPYLAEIVRRLVAALQPERIYLFGSRARGEAKADSDYDVLVIVSNSDMPQHKREQAAYHHLWGVGVPIDVLVLTTEECERQASVVTSLPATVREEGEIVYRAA